MRVPIDGGLRDLPALWWKDGALCLLDQRALPGRVEVLTLRRAEDVAEAIRTMAVRGAPAIGAAAAYGMALGAVAPDKTAALLKGTRPTARDLFHAVELLEGAIARGEDPVARADAYTRELVERCRRIGEHGASLLQEGARVLTHCNAGALATVDWGTALAPLRVAHRRGRAMFVWCGETRPRLQGLLTAWELQHEGIPCAVIPDNAAGHYLARGEVDLCIVGADRIARNGDTANKIGTYEKAVLAREHGVPFYVAAPRSTFDGAMADGARIPIEERAEQEVLELAGQRVAPPGLRARNPAFDVTPARFIAGFVTEDGILAPGEVAAWLGTAPARPV
ncbi:MAG TPA: S-methyl-5-thioribose-1-phosphate isomerase [Candidatus Thermoplasmatota archaeon]|jgi:S-methyl-5-thioribose-1-phosphate isomerase|nr:S-methyl-5-thioribose-1-phosphate isomerase [Candidatus Thermoplasmatota archaeon]